MIKTQQPSLPRRRRLLSALKPIACLPWLGVWATANSATSALDAELLLAVSMNNTSSVSGLLLRGANPNATDATGNPAVIVAFREKAYSVVEYLIASSGFEADRPNPQGETALMYAAMRGQLKLAEKLVKAGAQVNREGWAPLHYAVYGDQLDMIRWLIEQHAYIDAESPNQTTPLMLAARQKSREMCKLLIELGADATYTNQSKMTASRYATKAGDEELGAWLDRRAQDFRKKYGQSN